MNEIQIGKVYRHYKGKYIFVENLGKYSENDETVVIYKGINDGGIFVRPISSFLEEVEPNKYRFELVEY